MQEEKKLNIVYEDNHVIVVVKPQNVPSQEDETGDLDMLNMVKNYVKIKYNKPGNVFVGLVHRLDRPTGGLMVFAKTSKAASRLSEQIQDGRFNKKYLTVLIGCPTDRRKKQVNFLKKDEKNNIVKIVPMGENGAKRAELIYNIIKISENNLSLAEIELLTGRSHQIRVQMASLRTPVFGDIKYGAKKSVNASNDPLKTTNLALWAYKLSFEHPTTKNVMTFKCYPELDNEPWNQFEIEKLV